MHFLQVFFWGGTLLVKLIALPRQARDKRRETLKKKTVCPRSHSLWSEALAKADVTRRRAEVDAFNAANRWTKRGLALLPTMYGVNFPVNMLNQVCALVMVYTDGTVLVSHGGVEMGQGLNTKMAQVSQRLFWSTSILKTNTC